MARSTKKNAPIMATATARRVLKACRMAFSVVLIVRPPWPIMPSSRTIGTTGEPSHSCLISSKFEVIAIPTRSKTGSSPARFDDAATGAAGADGGGA